MAVDPTYPLPPHSRWSSGDFDLENGDLVVKNVPRFLSGDEQADRWTIRIHLDNVKIQLHSSQAKLSVIQNACSWIISCYATQASNFVIRCDGTRCQASDGSGSGGWTENNQEGTNCMTVKCCEIYAACVLPCQQPSPLPSDSQSPVYLPERRNSASPAEDPDSASPAEDPDSDLEQTFDSARSTPEVSSNVEEPLNWRERQLIPLLNACGCLYNTQTYSQVRGVDSKHPHKEAFQRLLVNSNDSDPDARAMKLWLQQLVQIALERYFTQENLPDEHKKNGFSTYVEYQRATAAWWVVGLLAPQGADIASLVSHLSLVSHPPPVGWIDRVKGFVT